MMMNVLWACLAVAMVGADQARDTMESGRTGAAVITGVVTVDDASNVAIRRVILTIAGTGISGGRQVVSDDQGRFAFTGLAGGRYTVTAEKPPFVKTFFGSRRPGRGPGTSIVVSDGQRATISVKLTPGATIAGVIADENGVPLASAQVSVLKPVFVDGERRFVDVSGPQTLTTTDDQGRYRLYGLAAGEYTVTATAAAGGLGGLTETTQAEIDLALREIQSGATASQVSTNASAPPLVTRMRQYFPAAADVSSAQTMTLNPGDERTGVNVTIPLVRAGRVDGVSVGPTGQPMQNVWITMLNAGTQSMWSSPGAVRPAADGRFSLGPLPPGRYRLVGRGEETGTSPSGGPVPMALWGDVEFTVNGADLPGVMLQFAPGVAVPGKVVFQGAQPPPDLTSLRMSIAPVGVIPGSVPTPQPFTSPSPDGTFTLTGVAPGKYRITATGMGAWSLRAAWLDGRDTLDAPFEVLTGRDTSGLQITFVDQATELSGTIFDPLGRPAPEYSIVAFSTDRAHWSAAPRRISGAIKPSTNGTYKISGLPPGEYYMAVLIDADPGQVNDPSFLEQLIPAAIKVSLAEGEKKTQDLRLGG